MNKLITGFLITIIATGLPAVAELPIRNNGSDNIKQFLYDRGDFSRIVTQYTKIEPRYPVSWGVYQANFNYSDGNNHFYVTRTITIDAKNLGVNENIVRVAKLNQSDREVLNRYYMANYLKTGSSYAPYNLSGNLKTARPEIISPIDANSFISFDECQGYKPTCSQNVIRVRYSRLR